MLVSFNRGFDHQTCVKWLIQGMMYQLFIILLDIDI